MIFKLTNSLILSLFLIGFVHLEAQNNLIISSEPDVLQIKIYSGGFATIHETRDILLDKGENHIFFSNLPLPNFNSDIEYSGDLIPSYTSIIIRNSGISAFLEKAIGSEITVTGRAGSVSGILEEVHNNLLLLRDMNNRQVIVFNHQDYSVKVNSRDEKQTNLQSGVLAVYNAESAGIHRLNLWYHTGYLGWAMEDQVLINSEDETLNWHSILYLKNNTETVFSDAILTISSANVNAGRGFLGFGSSARNPRNPDLFIHTLEEPLTLPSNVDVRKSILNRKDIPYRKSYRYNAQYSRSVNIGDRRPTVSYHINTSEFGEDFQSLPRSERRLILETDDGFVLIGDRLNPRIIRQDEEVILRGGTASSISINELIEFRESESDERVIKKTGTYNITNFSEEEKQLSIIIAVDKKTQLVSISEPDYNRCENSLEIHITLKPSEKHVVNFEMEIHEDD